MNHFFYKLKANPLEATSGILIFLFSPLLMTVPHGGSSTLLLLLLLSLIGLSINKDKLPLNQQEIWLFTTISIYFVINLFNVWYFNTGISYLDNVSRFLLLLPVYFYIRKIKLSFRYVIFGIAAGAIACFSIALFQILYLGIKRADGLENAVPFGGLSMTFGLMCLAIALMIKNRGEKIWMYISFVLATIAAVLSGTRGAWLVLPVGLMTLLILNPCNWSAKKKVIGSLITLSLLMLAYKIPLVQTRVDITLLNLVAYFTEATVNTSIGLRLETWWAAIIVSMENPVLGIGEGNFDPALGQLAEAGKIDPIIATHVSHIHNEFLSTMLYKGFLGLTLTLLLFLLPLATFYTQFKRQQGEKKILLAVGIMLIVSSVTTSLSDVFFKHHTQTLFYVTYIYLIYGLVCVNIPRTFTRAKINLLIDNCLKLRKIKIFCR